MIDNYIKLMRERDDILKKYTDDLLKEIKRKTGLTIPDLNIDISRFTRFLEKFININKLFDIKKIWSKYEEKYQRFWDEFAEQLPINRMREEIVKKLKERYKKLGLTKK